ncbi:MAG: DUF2892 domain-containing protein [Cryomorphaceae bacterium]|jgi:hypothetical protein|nr:DUF2892 domain-containing protein [Cryomorphaceae bacterium]
MKKNMGRWDKTLRIVASVIIAVLFWNGTLSGIFGIGLLLFAGIFLLTSFIGFCPLYLLFNLNTYKRV